MNFTKWPIHAHDGPVGEVTTALWSPRLEKNIGYAWLPIELATNGTQVTVGCPNGEQEATVVPMPFIDPMKEIPKAKAQKSSADATRRGSREKLVEQAQERERRASAGRHGIRLVRGMGVRVQIAAADEDHRDLVRGAHLVHRRGARH